MIPLESQETPPQSPLRRSLFAWWGILMYRYRIWVIAIWGLVLVISLALTPTLENALQETGTVYEGGEAYRTEQLLQQELKLSPAPLILVFQSQPNPATEINQLEVEQLLSQIRHLPSVKSVVSAVENPEYRSADGLTQYSIIELQKNESKVAVPIAAIEQILERYKSDNSKAFLTGKSVVEAEVQRISKADLSLVELGVLPITLVALIVVFGSVVAASIPVAMGVMTVLVTFGILSLVALNSSVSVFALNLTTMLGLGLGIDYSLLIVNRLREELRASSPESAIAQTLDTAGRAVAFSGLTVGIGLICLILFPISLLQSLGLAGAIVVFLSVAAALTLLPALLGLVGQRIVSNRGQSQWGAKQRGFWAAIARIVTRHSLVAVMVVLAIVAGLTSPFFAARFGLPNADILPKASPAREGVEILQGSFGAGETTPIWLAIRTKTADESILSPQHLATLYHLVTKLKADPRVAGINSLVNIDPRLTLENYQQLYSNPQLIQSPKLAVGIKQLSNNSITLVMLKSRTLSNDVASRRLVEDLRSLTLEGLEIQVAGQTADEIDTIEAIYQRFPFVLGAMMIATYGVLYLLLSSVILPLKAIAMNILSIGASFGALVFIFQQGNWQSWLNFTPVGYLDILLPVVLFYILFGLSMDYEVFLLTRIKEAYDRCHDNDASIIEGLEHTGSIITSAALLMVIVTIAFTFTSIIFVKALGLGSAIAIVIDTTLIRAILVPATMHLMGRWNWWFPKLPARIS